MVNITENHAAAEPHRADLMPTGFHATRFVFSGKCFDVNGERITVKDGNFVIKTVIPKKPTKYDDTSSTPFKIKIKITTMRRADIIADSKLTGGATAFVFYLSKQTAVRIVKAMNDQAGFDFINLHIENCFFAFEMLQNWNRDGQQIMQLMDAIRDAVGHNPERPSAKYTLNYIDKKTFDVLISWAGFKLRLQPDDGVMTFEFEETDIPKKNVAVVSQQTSSSLAQPAETSQPTSNKPKFTDPPRKSPPPKGYKVLGDQFTHGKLCEFYFNGWASDALMQFGISRILQKFGNQILDRVLVAPAAYFGRMFDDPINHTLSKKTLTEAEIQAFIEKRYNAITQRELNDAFDKHFLIFPACFNSHWNLVVVMNPAGPVLSSNDANTSPDCHVIVMDSLLSDVGSNVDNMHRDLVSWVSHYLKMHYAKRQPLNFLPFGQYNRARVSRHVPYCLQQQDNADDCGLFALFFLEQFLRHVPEIQTTAQPRIEDWNIPTFVPSNLRRELVLDILEQNNVDKDWFEGQLRRPAYLDLGNYPFKRIIPVPPAANGDASKRIPNGDVQSNSKTIEAAINSKPFENNNSQENGTTEAPVEAGDSKSNGIFKSAEAVESKAVGNSDSKPVENSKPKRKRTQKPKPAETAKSKPTESAKSESPAVENGKPKLTNASTPKPAPKAAKANAISPEKPAVPSQNGAASSTSASSSVTQKRPAPSASTANGAVSNGVPQKRKKPEVIRGFCKKPRPRPAPAAGQTEPVFFGTMGLEAEREEVESEEE
uniref:ULP_PROTEASE domain-containing protein n=1 Tax=Panagrellus redivivus TaxID=6233 RepID=A0A7E4ZUL5_PANRE